MRDEGLGIGSLHGLRGVGKSGRGPLCICTSLQKHWGASVDTSTTALMRCACGLHVVRCRALSENAMAKRLLALMQEKQSNLSVAADVNTCAEVLALAEAIGPHVCVFKTHVDVLADFTPEFGQQLMSIADKHKFLIFEDRKFADIGNTVSMQYSGGVYKIADWSHITNAHTVPGPGIIDGLAVAGLPKGRGLLLLGEMSSSGTLAAGDYTKKTVEMAVARRDFCMGFICTSRLSEDPAMVHMTPGVQLEQGTDNLGQRYLTPEIVIAERTSGLPVPRNTSTASLVSRACAGRSACWQPPTQWHA